MTFLHIATAECSDLDEAAARVFRALGVEEVAEHESANYYGGRYFRGRSAGVQVEISLEDEVGYDDYDFWVVVEPVRGSTIDIDREVDRIAHRLTASEIEVCRSLDDDEEADEHHIVRLVYEAKARGGVPTTRREIVRIDESGA